DLMENVKTAKGAKKKGADDGIDGYIYFNDDGTEKYKKLLVQAKSGTPSVKELRDLIGTMTREKAEIGVFMTLKPPTKPMREEAVSAGFYVPDVFPDRTYTKVQIFTIEDLLKGKRPEYPQMSPAALMKKAMTDGKK